MIKNKVIKVNQTLYNKLKADFKRRNQKKYHKYYDYYICDIRYEQVYNYNNQYWIDKKYY
jgi:hypothetical protein